MMLILAYSWRTLRPSDGTPICRLFFFVNVLPDLPFKVGKTAKLLSEKCLDPLNI